jgi:hypothetical protein
MTQIRGDKIDLGLRLLDHQLVDSEEMRCGKVDDIAFEGEGDELVVVALLSGPRAQGRRLPNWMRRIVGWIGRDVEHRVEWQHVAGIDSAIRLSSPSEELKLGEGDRKLRPLVERLPRS